MTGPLLPGRRVAHVDFQATSATDRKRCAVCRSLVAYTPANLGPAATGDLERHASEKHGGTVRYVEPGLTV